MKNHNNITQGTAEWLHIRKGKITGTGLQAIMGTPYAKGEYLYEMIAQRLTVGVEEEYENPLDRGHRLEPEAVAAFELETGKQVNKTGFCESENDATVANSPDGLIGEDEAVEIKCPQGKNYVKIWLKNQIPKEYVWQVVQYFVVNPAIKKVYFVAYNPDIPAHPIHIIETPREELAEKIDKAMVAQKAFLEEVNEKLKGIIKL